MNFKLGFDLLKQTFDDWNADKAPRLGAALAYYTVFSMAPLLLVIVAVAGLVFGKEAARGQITEQIANSVGPKSAEFITQMLSGASEPSAGILAVIVGIATLLLGAVGVFGQLQGSLNTVWDVQPRPDLSVLEKLKARFTPFVMVIGITFLLMVSMTANAAVAAFGEWISDWLALPEWTLKSLVFVVGFAVITLLFAMIFKILPDVIIGWRDVWIGAILTSALFYIGQLGLSWYVRHAVSGSTYGAAGSLVALLMWVYWAAQIVFFGAEFTQVYANRFGAKILPAANAVAMTETDRARQGMTTKNTDKKKQLHETMTPTQKNDAARRAKANSDQSINTQNNQLSPQELVQDIGAVLTGLGLVLILKRLFGRKS